MLRKLTNGAAISTFLEEENMRAIDGIKAAVEMCNAQTIIKCISMFQSIMALKKIIGKKKRTHYMSALRNALSTHITEYQFFCKLLFF